MKSNPDKANIFGMSKTDFTLCIGVLLLAIVLLYGLSNYVLIKSLF